MHETFTAVIPLDSAAGADVESPAHRASAEECNFCAGYFCPHVSVGLVAWLSGLTQQERVLWLLFLHQNLSF